MLPPEWGGMTVLPVAIDNRYQRTRWIILNYLYWSVVYAVADGYHHHRRRHQSAVREVVTIATHDDTLN